MEKIFLFTLELNLNLSLISTAVFTEPGLFLPVTRKGKPWDDEMAAQRQFNHKAAKWGNRRMSLKSASPKMGTQGYLGVGGKVVCSVETADWRWGEVR